MSCQDFSVVQGETATLLGHVVSNDSDVDMTGGSVLWATAANVIVKSTTLATITWINQATGWFQIELSVADIATFTTAKGASTKHECWVKTAAGQVARIWDGQITTEAPSVTPIV